MKNPQVLKLKTGSGLRTLNLIAIAVGIGTMAAGCSSKSTDDAMSAAPVTKKAFAPGKGPAAMPAQQKPLVPNN